MDYPYPFSYGLCAGFDKFRTLSVLYWEKVCLFINGTKKGVMNENGDNGYRDPQRGERRKI